MSRLLAYFRKVLDLRIRALAFALVALLGWIAGMITHQGMALKAIDQMQAQTITMVREHRL